MALKLKYTDEHGILHIDMSPTSTPRGENRIATEEVKTDITDPKFDTINNRFGQYDLFGGKYDVETGGEAQTPRSLFRSRYNSIEEELANTPYAFATERSLRLNSAGSPIVDITIKSRTLPDESSPSKDIEDDRFFNRNPIDYDLFGPQIDFQSSVKTSDEEDPPAFTVTQLIHAQDRYFDLSSRHSSSVVDSPKTESVRTVKAGTVKNIEVKSEPGSAKKRTVKIVNSLKSRSDKDEAFKVLSSETEVTTLEEPAATRPPVVPTSSKKKKESSFAIITETPVASRPSSPRSLPIETRTGRVSPFKGRGFREETSRHTTPKTSAANSRASSPPRRRTNSLPRIDKMATATLPPPIHTLSRPHSPRNFLKENIEEVRELSELNREKHEAEAEQRRKEEEEALLKEMAEFENTGKTDAIRSVVCSRTTSRSNSPSKIKLRSRSNSPAVSPSAVLRYENLSTDSKEFINVDDGMSDPVTHQSRGRSVSKSQPHSNDGSPKHSKIPKRQSSVSPNRNNKREVSNSRKPVENNLNRNQRFISNSTSSIHETIRIGSQNHDKRNISQSTQLLNIAPAHIKGKPPIFPGKGGPPPSNKSINSKRLSPIVGTPNKSPIEDLKPSSAKTPTKPSPVVRKPVKTAGNTPATSRLNSRQPSRHVSRDSSPDKRKTVTKPFSATKPVNNSARSKPVVRAASTKSIQKPTIPIKTDPKKPINRTNSMKSLVRTPSTKTLNEKPPLLKKRDSRMDLKATSMSKINEVGSKKEDVKKSPKKLDKGKDITEKGSKVSKVDKENVKDFGKATENIESSASGEEISMQDNETQYDKIINDKGELVILTKKNIVSMTTAAITSQPLEVVTKVTNQLPAALEKAREKGIFERHSSKDSLAPKEDDKESVKPQTVETEKANIKESTNEKFEQEKTEDKKVTKPVKEKSTVFAEDNVKLKPLLPPYNNPQVERAKQKIDDILKSPEVSAENIVIPPKVKEQKNTFKNLADKTKKDIKESKDETANKFANLKDQIVKQNEKATDEIRSEVTKIVDSIITPVEEPKDTEKAPEVAKVIEPIVMVVNEKKNTPIRGEILEKMTETLVKGEAEVEVQSSNVSSPGGEKMDVQNRKAEGSESDKSMQSHLSNGGFPQSTSTTPKPPARSRKDQPKDDSKQSSNDKETTPGSDQSKKPNICQRLMRKCKSKCCPCCIRAEDDDEKETKDVEAPAEKRGVMSRLNCCRKDKEAEDMISEIERAAGKTASIQIENETNRSRKFRDVMCACCGRRRRVSDVSDVAPRRVGDMSDVVARHVAAEAASGPVADVGCCGRKRPEVERRDSILSDRPPASCCNNRLFTWVRGACRRHHSEQLSSSRRQSLFSKNKSLSPTLPPEDTRVKLDPSLIEHTSVMRGAIPVLPLALAYFCLCCNVVVPGLGTIFSGMFCLCFGIPRFGAHDGAKYRIGSFFINLLVGCGQLFTVLFCLVGWGWSIWWGVIMVRTSRKYRKLKAEAAEEEAESAPPVTANNHTQA